jgi:hypothetical protein
LFIFQGFEWKKQWAKTELPGKITTVSTYNSNRLETDFLLGSSANRRGFSGSPLISLNSRQVRILGIVYGLWPPTDLEQRSYKVQPKFADFEQKVFVNDLPNNARMIESSATLIIPAYPIFDVVNSRTRSSSTSPDSKLCFYRFTKTII